MTLWSESKSAKPKLRAGWVVRELSRQGLVYEVVTQFQGCDMGEDKGFGAEVTESRKLQVVETKGRAARLHHAE